MTDAQKRFFSCLSVSHETINALHAYEELLSDWNQKFNLVAESTLPQLWTRHFLDSAQLIDFIPTEAQSLADMGAGAGFPGLVLAILAQERKQDLHIHAIESTNKKADFLQAVVDALKLKVTVHRARVEAIKDLKVDILTARALKPLPQLLSYAQNLLHKDSLCLFLKGQTLEQELTEARKRWTFSATAYPSRSDDTGRVLVLRDLRFKTRR